MRERGRVRMMRRTEIPVRISAQGPGPVGSAANMSSLFKTDKYHKISIVSDADRI